MIYKINKTNYTNQIKDKFLINKTYFNKYTTIKKLINNNNNSNNKVM
jgi:hypothetical protein